MHAPAHVMNAVVEEVARSRRPDGYDHLYLSRGKLHTPDGEIPVKKIGKGMFSTVYREQDGAGRVFAFEREGTSDKEIAEESRVPGNPHVPAVERFGSTRDESVYVMPFYKAPLRKSDSPLGWRDYVIARDCLEKEKRKLNPKTDWGYPLMVQTVECAKEKGISPPVGDALQELVNTASNYGEYTFEFSPANLATDDAGNLVLLDVVFDREVAWKIREEQRRAREARERARRWR